MIRNIVCTVLAFCLAFAFCPAALAEAAPYYDSDQNVYELDGFENGSTCNLALGGKLVVPEGYTVSFSGEGIASYDEPSHTISGVRAGKVTVAYSSKTDADGNGGGLSNDESDAADGEWDADDDDGDDPAEVETGSFTLQVVSYDSLQGKSYRAVKAADGWEPAALTIKAKGIDEKAGVVELLNDTVKSTYSKKYPDAQLERADDNRIVIAFERTGTHKVTLAINGKTFTITVKVVALKLNTEAAMLCKGKGATLKVVNAKKVKFASSNGLVAKVSKKGKITPRQLGNCTITVTAEGLTFTCAVGVTSKAAYKAVKNAESDYKKNIAYSQTKRMSANYRDCSSYVSRSYWDPGLGRKLFAIGGASVAGTWAYPAAEQAQWLNRNGKRIAYKAVNADKLLPGDVIYFETGYAGKYSGYRHIDHAAIYVGGGLYLNTGSYGVKTHAAFAYHTYSAGDSSVRFIGRPISSFVLDRAAVTLKAGKSTAVKALFAKGKVKYKSSKPAVAKVNGKGAITAKKPGTCTVTAKCKAGTYRCKVTVK